MIDTYDKTLKITAISLICLGAFISLMLLMLYGAIGGNAIAQTAPFTSNTSASNAIIETANNLFIDIFNMSWCYLFLFIAGLWFYVVADALKEDLRGSHKIGKSAD